MAERETWLKQLDDESSEHLGTLSIHGREVDMNDVTELRQALIWVAWTSTGMLHSLQDKIDKLEKSADA